MSACVVGVGECWPPHPRRQPHGGLRDVRGPDRICAVVSGSSEDGIAHQTSCGGHSQAGSVRPAGDPHGGPKALDAAARSLGATRYAGHEPDHNSHESDRDRHHPHQSGPADGTRPARVVHDGRGPGVVLPPAPGLFPGTPGASVGRQALRVSVPARGTIEGNVSAFVSTGREAAMILMPTRQGLDQVAQTFFTP